MWILTLKLLIEQALLFEGEFAQKVGALKPGGIVDAVVLRGAAAAHHRVKRIVPLLEVAVAGVHHERHRLQLARDLLVRALILLRILRERSMIAEKGI